MILSAILLTLREITLTQERDIAITSKAQIGQDVESTSLTLIQAMNYG
jgi:hypothetical protein